MERRGCLLPLVEAHVRYLGRARYDDPLRVTTRIGLAGKARVRFDVAIVHAEGGDGVADGYTVHAVLGPDGRPTRPPAWLTDLIEGRRNP